MGASNALLPIFSSVIFYQTPNYPTIECTTHRKQQSTKLISKSPYRRTTGSYIFLVTHLPNQSLSPPTIPQFPNLAHPKFLLQPCPLPTHATLPTPKWKYQTRIPTSSSTTTLGSSRPRNSALPQLPILRSTRQKNRPRRRINTAASTTWRPVRHGCA